jgi:NADH-ubiquinone oxidoreductase chain 6
MLNLLATFSIFKITSPLPLSGVLLFTAILTARFSGILFSSWFFYFLTLVFLGGVMVIVLFLCSICSNKKILFLNMPRLLPFILFPAFFLDTLNIKRIFIKNSFSNPIILSLYQSNSTRLLFVLIGGLILCLIGVIIITKLDHGPLLSSN